MRLHTCSTISIAIQTGSSAPSLSKPAQYYLHCNPNRLYTHVSPNQAELQPLSMHLLLHLHNGIFSRVQRSSIMKPVWTTCTYTCVSTGMQKVECLALHDNCSPAMSWVRLAEFPVLPDLASAPLVLPTSLRHTKGSTSSHRSHRLHSNLQGKIGPQSCGIL